MAHFGTTTVELAEKFLDGYHDAQYGISAILEEESDVVVLGSVFDQEVEYGQDMRPVGVEMAN